MASHQHQQQQQAPFSFHCRLCYERLNFTDRPPVVLPCGHTYICQVCSSKLTRCMECRTRIFPLPTPPPKPDPSVAHQYPHGHIVRKSYRQRQIEGRQNYYLQKEQHRRLQHQEFPVPTTVDELHTVLQKTADPEQPRPKLPKNVVLMSLMEAAQEKQAGWLKEDQDGYESGDDDTMVQAGLGAMGAPFGTYVVKKPEGLWVYDQKHINPNASSSTVPISNIAVPLSRTNSLSSTTGDPPGKSPAKAVAASPATKENEEPNNVNTSMSSSSAGIPVVPLTRVRSKPRTSSSQQQALRNSYTSRPISPDPGVASGAYSDTSGGSYRSSSASKQRSGSASKQRYASPAHSVRSGTTPQLQREPKAMERLIHGQTVQIVQVQDGVAQLARAGGYIRLEHPDDLVKVGEPADEACRIEGIIFSIAEEKRQYKKSISNLHKLEKSLQSNLRKFFIKEAKEIEEKRQLAKREQQQRQIEQQQKLNTSVCSSSSKESSDPRNRSIVSRTPSVVEELLAEEDEIDVFHHCNTGTGANITPPRSGTPPPNLLEMTPSGMSSGPGTPATPHMTQRNGRTRAANARGGNGVVPPVTSQYRYELEEPPKTPNTTPVKVLDGNDHSEEKKSDGGSVSWEEDIFNQVNQGCDLFFCATMPLCIGHNTMSAADFSSPSIGLHPTSSILQPQSPQQRQRHYVQASHDPGYLEDRNESYDGGSHISSGSTVGSGGVDFATGLSGHTGISRGRRRRIAPRKQVRMMSQHDGIGHIRPRREGKNFNGGASVVSMGGCSRASVVTL